MFIRFVLVYCSIHCQRLMLSWSRRFTDTARQDFIGFGNTEWLAEVLFAQIASDQKFDRLLDRLPSCCFSLSQLTDFRSKGKITSLFFSDMKDLMNIYKRSDQMLFRKHCLDFFLCNVVWSNGAMLSVVCEMEPLGQYCISFSCTMLSHEYEENFARDFAQDFSCAMLSGASRTTLHWVLTCAMLSPEY